ncbi:glycosyltransferase [Radiobacillus kanasensis]|uniref:glycosyltransferase family protein n=1 Tax=Radiobacillus kanasensis TaxID=2844358 RepID=UPI001E34DAA8|nr:glycosyltransferase [Radiobacillus kanasensis]UFU00042.1 glycosyltransferase [Radiobacillus kanasensis]
MKKKVCMLLSYLPFLDARIFECETKSLVKHGYEVTIIAPRKNRFLHDIDGKPFTDRFREKVFKYQGVKVVTYDSERRSDKPILDPLYQLGMKENADFYHAHELSSLHLGKELKVALNKRRGKNVKLIYDSRQLTPDPFSKNLKEAEKQKWQKMLHESLKETDYTITVSDSIKAWYLSFNPMLPVEVIYSSPPLATSFQVKGQNKSRLAIAYEGNVSKETLQKIYAITDSCRKVSDFHFKVVGGLRYGETMSIPNHLQNNMINSGWINYHALPTVLSDVDIGLIDLDSTHSLNNAFSMPGKLFSFLNNGIPVVVNDCSDLKKFVNTYECGIVINKQNPTPAEYVKGIIHLYQNKSKLRQMSLNARKVMEEAYSWEHMEKRLIAIYKSLDSSQTPYLLT